MAGDTRGLRTLGVSDNTVTVRLRGGLDVWSLTLRVSDNSIAIRLRGGLDVGSLTLGVRDDCATI